MHHSEVTGIQVDCFCFCSSVISLVMRSSAGNGGGMCIPVYQSTLCLSSCLSALFHLVSVNKNNSNTTFRSEFSVFLKPFSVNCDWRMLYFISLIYCLLIYIYISDSPLPTTLHLVPVTFHLFLNDSQQYCNRSMIKCLKILMYTCIVAQTDVSGVKYIIFCSTYWNCNVLVQGGTKVVTFGVCVGWVGVGMGGGW